MQGEENKKKKSFLKTIMKKLGLTGTRKKSTGTAEPAKKKEAPKKTSLVKTVTVPARKKTAAKAPRVKLRKGTPEYKADRAARKESALLRRRRTGRLSKREIRRIEKTGERLWQTDPEFYKKKKPWILRFFRWCITVLLFFVITGGIIAVIGCGVVAVYVYSYTDPELIELLGDQDIALSSTLYVMGEDGEYVEYETWMSSEYRQWVSIYDVCDNVKDALVATEDHRFYEHPGVDPITTVKAVATYAFAKVTGMSTRNIAGGSGITQQLVKNVTQDDSNDVGRKIREALRALYLERVYSKDQILEYYLNEVYFGNNCYGIATAAQYYFGKTPAELSILEAASIVGITKNPENMEPFGHPDANRERRNNVLYMMYTKGKITEEEFDENYNADIVLRDRTVKTSAEVNWSYATDTVFEAVIADLMETYGISRSRALNKLYTGGLKIYSTFDLEIQTIMEEYVANEENYEGDGKSYSKEMYWVEDRVDKDGTLIEAHYVYPQVAMEIMDPKTGNILGLIGGRGTKKGKLGLNRVTATKRQPGSSIKPLTVYGYALENGYITTGTTIDDFPTDAIQATDKDGKPATEFIIQPVLDPLTGEQVIDPMSGYPMSEEVEVPVMKGWPVNFDGTYNGLINILKALSWSFNTPSVQVLDMITVQNSYNFAKTMLGLQNLITQDMDRAPLSVGSLTYGVTVQEMTAAYTVYANGGIYTAPRCYTKVEDYLGNTILKKDIDSRVVFSPQTAYLMTSILLKVTSISAGGRMARVTDIETAGKTGTTSRFTDRWFVGYTPYYLGGIWWGYDENYPVDANTSWQTHIWGDIMNAVHTAKGYTSGTFEMPEDIVSVTYCIDSGKLENEYCAQDPRGNRLTTTYFRKGTEPTEICDVHHALYVCDASGQIAHDNCPSAHLQVFVDYMRTFPILVEVDDAQYLCPRLTPDMVLTNDPVLPVYTFMYEEGAYPGVPIGSLKSTTTKRYKNCLCSLHTPYDDPHIYGAHVDRTQPVEEPSSGGAEEPLE